MSNKKPLKERDRLVTKLNFLSTEEKNNWWLNNQVGCIYKDVDKDKELEFNWYHFTNQNIWMCRVYDKNQLKSGKGHLREVLYFKEKESLTQIYREWIAR